MSKTPFLVFGCALLLLLFLALDVSGHRIEDDLEFSASGKQKKYEKGSESEHHESDYEKKGKKGKMGYEMKHGEENGKKSHHEKESHEGEYDEKRSHEKGHHDEGGYFEKKAEGKKGQKGHKFYEEGSFKKGHSIKGKHVVHSLDESKKDKEFFEEDNDEAYDEKHGDFHEDHASKKGGSHKKGHHEKHYAHAIGGKKGIGKKGNLHDEESGHKGEKKHESHIGNKSEKSKKGCNNHHNKYGHRSANY